MSDGAIWLRDLLGRMSLTTGSCARLVGVHERTMRRYVAGSREIPLAIIRLLMVAELFPVVRDWLELECEATALGHDRHQEDDP